MNVSMTVRQSNRPPAERRLNGPELRIGRNPDCQLVFDHDAVSWDHAVIRLTPTQATLADLGSTNGTFRNGQKVNDATPLWPGDTIRLGQTGPTLTITAIDLTDGSPPPAPVATPAAANSSPRAAPVMSETRGIALQAVRELMAQQETQARHKRHFAAVALALLALLLFLGGLLFLFRDRFERKTEALEGGLTTLGQSVDEQRAKIDKLTNEVRDGFDRVDQEFEKQREQDKKTEAALRDLALRAAQQEAAVRGIPDKVRELGLTLEQLNERLAKAAAAAANANRPPAAAPAPRPPAVRAPEKPIRIEPGQKIDVILKSNQLYTGSLVAFDGQTVKVQTIPDPQARPSAWDIRQVQAFQTRDGIFAFNEATGQFERALTFFRFNRSTQKLERMESSEDTFMAQDARVYGPTNSVHALLSIGSSGEWCIGLPLPASRSPDSLDAYHFKEIVTSKGVYTYSESKQDFEYKSHSQIAQEAKAANDKAWAEYNQRNWDRRVQDFQLKTERLKALAPLFWNWNVWW